MASLLGEDTFHPAPPRTFEDLGIPETFVDSMICKQILQSGVISGRQLADLLCIPFGMLEPRFLNLRSRSHVTHRGSAPLNDYLYALTEQGREHAQTLMDSCAYVGPLPVPLSEYINGIEAQSIRAEAPQRAQIQASCKDICVNPEIYDELGPAVNSGSGLFLYVLREMARQRWPSILPSALGNRSGFPKSFMQITKSSNSSTAPITSRSKTTRRASSRKKTLTTVGSRSDGPR